MIDLPADIAAVARVLAGAAMGCGWLNAEHRLRWGNDALLALVERDAVPANGLALEEFATEPERFGAALRCAAETGQAVVLAGMRWRRGHMPVDVRMSPVSGTGDGLLIEVSHRAVPVAVPVSASLRSLAHELKNPLGGLRGAAQLLSRRVLDADLRAYAGIIVAEVDRLRALTERLLAPAARATMHRVNIHGVLERVRLLLAADGIDIVRDYDPSLPDCVGDTDRLIQVFLNLVRNAAESGAECLTFRSRFERAASLVQSRGDALRIDVIDDGPGVPDTVRATLFLPLVSGRDGGTGLGLAIAHEIVAEHGGRIAFESRPGQTTFTVWLPVGGCMP